jgi:bifunctional oligoribonuclease and PAP phosphatase NrnA
VSPDVDLGGAAARLDAARRVLLTCHLGPDGDALGSMSALACLLAERGREVTLYNPDPAPRFLRWLPRVETLVHKLPAGASFDLTVVVDCGDRKLLGPSFPPPEITGPMLVLDHHASSRPFGDVYLCDPGAASIGVLVARIAAVLGWTISPEAAIGVYVSIVSDTGSFRYSNTNAEVFQLASELVAERGVDPWRIAQSLGEEVPLGRYRLLAAALATIQLELEGKVATMVITEEMVRQAGARWEHSEGMVNYARALEGVEVGVLLTPAREAPDRLVRVSMRSKGRRVDAGAVCAAFGGGGHRGAAGCSIDGSLDDARPQVLAALAAALSGAALPPTPAR